MAYPLEKSPKQNELERIKKHVNESRSNFEENNKRWHSFRKFIFKTTLSQDDINNLMDLGKPVLEFNVIESFLSRLCGEFVKQEPSIETESNKDHPVQADVDTINVVDGYLRTILDESKRKGQTIEVYRDLLSGGYSVFEVYTDYENSKTFKQTFKVRRAFDPTLCGFDPLAQEPTKSDGNYCFKIYPKIVDEIKSQFPKAKIDELDYAKGFQDYSWSYYNQKNQKVALLVEFYEKKKKTIKLHRVSNGLEVTDKQYKELINIIKEKKLFIAPPTIIESRDSEEITICRYTLIENQILAYEETDFINFPLFFVDGNSISLRETEDGPIQQMTRPYFYNARDAQRLKNFAGQTWANELENMIQHKLMAALESIPPQYMSPYEDIQHASNIVYNAYANDDPNKPLPPPQVIPRVPIPPDVSNAFQSMDGMVQNILGTFDLSIGKLNDTQLSGLAIQETVTQSNATAMPILNGYILALNGIAQWIVDMLPKYIVQQRTLPVIDSQGKRNFVQVNNNKIPNSPKIDYPENSLQVHVEAGLNFEMQKARTMSQIIALMQASPIFAQFMNQKGLRILVDNLGEVRGIDQLKMLADAFMQQLDMQQKMAMQQQMMQMKQGQQSNPMVQLKQQELAMENQHHQDEMQIKAAQLQNEQAKINNDKTKMALNAAIERNEMLVQIDKANAEKQKAGVQALSKVHDQTLKHLDMMHNHEKDMAEFRHEVMKTANEQMNNQQKGE